MDHAEKFWRIKVRSWAATQPDCLRLDRVELYQECRVAGIVQRVRLDPINGEFRLRITDGFSSIDATWPLSPHMEQLRIAPGSGLILHGFARIDASGDPVFIDPAFEVVVGSEEA